MDKNDFIIVIVFTLIIGAGLGFYIANLLFP